MVSNLLADLVLILHLGFILFAVFGGLLVLRWPFAAWFHLPALGWALFVEFSSSICPLTPLENALRRAAGESGYEGGFIDHYLMPLLYPPGLTPRMQTGIAIGLLVWSAAIYILVWRRSRTAA